MKTITSAALAAAESASPQPVAILSIDFGGSVGMRHYADAALSSPVPAAAAVRDWGALAETLREGATLPATARVELHDPDGELRGLLLANGCVGKEALIRLHFRGLGESDLAPLFCGVVSGEPEWLEGGALVLALADLAAVIANRKIGIVATRALFPKIAEDDEGELLPIAYGQPRRVKAVAARHGACTTLVSALSATGLRFLVKDASRFPSGNIVVRIDAEEIGGHFLGNAFVVTARPHAYVTGSVDEVVGNPCIVKSSAFAGELDNQYAGLYVLATADGKLQCRLITQSVAETGALVLDEPFVIDGGDTGALPVSTSVSITTLPGKHKIGAHVQEVLDETVYIAAGHACAGIDAVEGWGSGTSKAGLGDIEVSVKHEGYITLPPKLYAVNLADAESFPDLGYAVTTVTLKRSPISYAFLDLDSDVLYISLRGAPDSSGVALSNPAQVIRHLLLNHGGLEAAQIDEDAFAAAATARAERAFSFALAKPRLALDAAADLAFQAGMALVFDEGVARVVALRNDAGGSTRSFGADQMVASSLRLGEAPLDDVYTEVAATYVSGKTQGALTIRDSAAEALHGRRVLDLDFWAYSGRHHVRYMAEWWLRRRRHRYLRLSFSAFLAGIESERGDVVGIERSSLLPSGQKARLLGIERRPGNPALGRMPVAAFSAELPAWAGCATACEHACETSACESAGCELSCTAAAEVSCTWTCESICEEMCELACTSTCQASCQGTCELSCRTSKESYDSSCQSTCETGCEQSCEGWACETGSEAGCASVCQTAGVQNIFPVREVKLLSSVSALQGSASVIQVDKAGNTFGESFAAWDVFDARPQLGEGGTVYLNYHHQWVFAPAQRLVKYVNVLSAGGSSGQFWVQEQARDGTPWGDSFLAWAVDSVG